MSLTTASMVRKSQARPGGLSHTEEKILRAFGELLPFARARDITRFLFKKGSTSYVSKHLTRLAGGADNINHYLVRFGSPNAPGNFARIYTIGRRGRDFLRELGVQVNFWYRPHKASNFSFSFLMHHLSVTQFLVALHAFCRENPDYQVLETRHGFTLACQPPCISLVADGQETHLPVIPDAWAYIEHTGIGDNALWIEVDHGTESKAKFQELVRNRINLVRSKKYAEYFDTPSVVFCYLTIGTTTDYRLTRLHKIRSWVNDLLTAQDLTQWAALFRYSTIDEGIYDTLMHFTDPVWYGPDSDTLVSLFTTPPKQEEADGHSNTTPNW